MISTVIFDLGNVLLHFNNQLIVERLRPFVDDLDAVRAAPAWKELVSSFERGQVDSIAFIEESVRMMHTDSIDHDRFMSIWNDIFWINEPLAALLPELSGKVRLVLLSNTNPLHIDFLQKRFPVLFDSVSLKIFSHEARMAKPDVGIYREVLKRANVAPEDCLFFDDIEQHVRMAASIGINAYQYVSVQGVRDILAAYEILEAALPSIPQRPETVT